MLGAFDGVLDDPALMRPGLNIVSLQEVIWRRELGVHTVTSRRFMTRAVLASAAHVKQWAGLGRRLCRESERAKGTSALTAIIRLFTGWERRSHPRKSIPMLSGAAECATIASSNPHSLANPLLNPTGCQRAG